MQEFDLRRFAAAASVVRSIANPVALAAAAALLMAALTLRTTPAHAQDPTGAAATAVPADAYADEQARELVRLARTRRRHVDTRITGYDVRARERISVTLGTPIGERLVFRRETASDVSWSRDSVHVHVVGAREVLPFIRAAPQVPTDLSSYMPSLAFDPANTQALLDLEGTSLRHPLAAGSEAHYRFAAGDSTIITLPDGRTVRLRELRIMPRRAEPQLISGSFWLEAETHAVVQAYFRLAARVEERNPIATLSAELDYIAMDYGLWELEWWLPRVVAAQGVATIAGRRLPISFERSYVGYRVTGDRDAPMQADSLVEPLCRPRYAMSITAQPGTSPLDTMSAETAMRLEAQADSVRRERQQARADSARRAGGEQAAQPEGRAAARAARRAAREACDRRFVVTREDHPDLLRNEVLPPDIYAGDTGFVDDAELRAIADRMRAISAPPWQVAVPSFEWPLNRPGLVRYNRVEGVSPGARGSVELGGATADATLRVGTASGEIGAELGFSRSGRRAQSRLAAYRRLDAVDVAADPFGLRSTLASLLLGRDDNDYFRAAGAELVLRPPVARPQWYDLRLFAERQSAVAAETDFSVARLLDSDRVVRPNIEADRATQVGATLRLRGWRGLNPDGLRWGAELEMHGEAGDYDFVRPALRLRASSPLFSRLSLGGEIAAGSSFGDAPLQRHWQLGGVGTLRGYDAAVMRGESFWHGRAELGYGLTFARLIGFTDAGWAGPRDGFGSGRALSSVGAGVSVLDGMLRFDVARARQTRAWKVHLHFNGVM